MKPLKLISFVWGENHISWMERSLIRSLCWPKNNEAIKDATWEIFLKQEEEKKVREMLERVGVKHVQPHYLPPQLQGSPREMGLFMLQGLLYVMADCVKNNAQMLMAPVDSFFSEGSIPNLLKLGRYGDTCVSVPHARVSPAIFGSIKDNNPLDGAELVDRLFKFPHAAWKCSENGAENQNTFIGGILWEKLGEKTWYMQHMLPTVYLANFTQSDLLFFQTTQEPPAQNVFGLYDHLWPSKLIREQRIRQPGSSDVACVLEVTKEDSNDPNNVQKVQCDPKAPYEFWRKAIHNQVMCQFPYILRGN